jgi:Ca2+-binding EF-hand superfamily protein
MIRHLLIAISTLAFLATAVAQDAKKPDKPQDSKPTRPPGPGMSAEAIVNSILERMDTNKDGKISKSEAKNRMADAFDQIDTNKDGFLDRKELLGMAQRLAAGPPGRPGIPGGGRPGPFGPRTDPLDFDALDKNADGRLTKEELRGTRFANVFDAIDKNRDGKIDPSEWAAYHNIKK